MFIPKQRNYKKYFLQIPKKKEYRSNKIIFGDIGLKMLKQTYITPNQLKAIRLFVKRNIKFYSNSQVWFRVFPYLPITKKPLEVRMGKGKGNVNGWVYPISGGQIIIEILNVPKIKAFEILKQCSYKLPVISKIIEKI